MTAQATNSLEYAGREWSVEGHSGSSVFRPEEHGVFCRGTVTACWRGWQALYAVSEADNVLRLSSLGVTLDPREHSGEPPLLFGKPPTRDPEYGGLTYENINEPLRFTGGLLIGDDYQRGWRLLANRFPGADYATIHELRFENGVLRQAADRTRDYEDLMDLMERQHNTPNRRGDGGEEALEETMAREDAEVRELMRSKLFFGDYKNAEFG